ncbi:MAG: hypothetical protein ABI783_09960 [Actinomycetota bacterium]
MKWGLIAAGLAMCLLLGGVGAYAYWTPSGSGSGTATAGEPVAVTLAPGTATTDLYPGMSGDVATSIANSNTHRVFVGSLVLDTTKGTNGFSVGGGLPGCDTSALSYTVQSNGGAGWFVAAGATLDLDLANAVGLSTAADTECQGAIFTVYLLAAA